MHTQCHSLPRPLQSSALHLPTRVDVRSASSALNFTTARTTGTPTACLHRVLVQAFFSPPPSSASHSHTRCTHRMNAARQLQCGPLRGCSGSGGCSRRVCCSAAAVREAASGHGGPRLGRLRGGHRVSGCAILPCLRACRHLAGGSGDRIRGNDKAPRRQASGPPRTGHAAGCWIWSWIPVYL